MRPSISNNRRPIDLEAVPEDAAKGFNYRTSLKRGAKPGTFATCFFLVVTIVSVLTTVTVRFVGPLITSSSVFGWSFAGMVIASVFLALPNKAYKDSRSTPIERFLLPLVGGLLLWFLLWSATLIGDDGLAGALPLLFIVLCIIYFSDQLSNHLACWMAADPRLREEDSEFFLRSWKSRWCFWKQPEHEDSEFQRKTAEVVATHRVRMLVFIGGASAGLLAFIMLSRANSLGRIIAGTFFLLITAAALCAYDKLRTHKMLPLFIETLLNWLTYNRQGTTAPGVFQSPAGSQLRRAATLAFVVFIAFFCVLPTAYYFPAGLLAAGPRRWAHAAQKADYTLTLGHNPEVQGMPTYDQIVRALSSNHRAYYEQLRTKQAREDYLDSVAYRIQLTGGHEGQFGARLAQRLSIKPESWLGVSLAGIAAGDSSLIFWILLSLLLSVLLPLAFLGYSVLNLSTGVLVSAQQAIWTARHFNEEAVPSWQAFVRRLRGLPDGPRDHLWLGATVFNDEPVFLDRKILHEHAHILGDTGSGKTSRALAPLVNQLISTAKGEDEFGDEDQPAVDGHSIVIIDLKGDPAFFAGARTAARAAGIPFKWFTTEPGLPTFVFNPFLQEGMRGLTPTQKTEVLLQALGLEHGEGYGRSHFSRSNRKTLLSVFEYDEFNAANPQSEWQRIYSFLGVSEVFKDKAIHKLTPDELEKASELISSIEILATIDALNVAPCDIPYGRVPQAAIDEAIDMGQVLQTPQVVYFYLPAIIGAASVREVGKLALYSLLTSANKHERRHGTPGRVYLVIDEFQQIVSEGIELVLRQARSKGIAAILANQTISDLHTPSANLIPIVQANTRFKQYFSAQDLEEQDALIKASGDALYDVLKVLEPEDPIDDDRVNWPRDIWGRIRLEEDRRQDIRVHPRLTRNDIIEMSNSPDQCIVHIGRGSGLSQFQGYPFLLRSSYHVTYERYLKWAKRKWPTHKRGVITPPLKKIDRHDRPVSAKKAKELAEKATLWADEKKKKRRKNIINDNDDA